MSKDYYTFLIIPQRKNSVKKIILSAALLKFCIFIMVSLTAAGLYFSYDCIKVKSGVKELKKYKKLATTQQEQIGMLAEKIKDFEKAMSDLQEFDKKIRMMTNLDNSQNASQLLGVGGPSSEEKPLETKAEEIEDTIIYEIHRNMDELLEEASYQENSFKELLDFLDKQKSILASMPSIWPVMGWVSSEFGYRVSPFTGKREFHKGIDIATRIGKEILAPADGLVKKVSRDNAIGNVVTIDHGNGIMTYYGHLLKDNIKKRGQKVKRGDVIGYVGNSGRSTGPHLHYAVSVDGIYVNPRKYLF